MGVSAGAGAGEGRRLQGRGDGRGGAAVGGGGEGEGEGTTRATTSILPTDYESEVRHLRVHLFATKAGGTRGSDGE